MTIPARYSGTCSERGGRGQPGDLIRAEEMGLDSDVRLVHAVCPDTPSDYEHHAPVCEHCWLSHAGECDR